MGYGVLVADPPWSFDDKLPGPGRGAEKHYSVLTLEGIKAFTLPEMNDDSYLFLWRVASQVEEAYQVVRAWGFTPKTEIVWNKLTVNGKPWFGMGRHTRAAHESCILAVRGKPKPKVRNIRSTFEAVAAPKHSQKPEGFYDLVERLCEGPYCEIFARRHRPGWDCFGDEL